MTTVVNMTVTGIDIDDEETMEMVEDQIGDVEFAARRGVVMLAVFVDDGNDVVHAATDAAHRLMSLVSGTKVERVDPELVTTSDIASRIGLSREAVRKWSVRDERGFPPPFGTTGDEGRTQKIWRWYEVSEWLKNVLGIDLDEQLPTVAEVARIDACLAGVPDIVSQEWKAQNQTRGTVVKVTKRRIDGISIASFHAEFNEPFGVPGRKKIAKNWEVNSA